jgi:hypothetical protein
VDAQLYRDYPLAELENVESLWAEAREKAAGESIAPGLPLLEHAHWDWRNKADSVEAHFHMLIAVECEGEPQGMMAVLRGPRLSRLDDGQVVYVDYVESAPWNLKASSAQPRFLGVGTVLIADAVRLSIETGLGGRVGLHSLPQAEPFYVRCGMTRLGLDRDYFDLRYFEFRVESAIKWLASIGDTV